MPPALTGRLWLIIFCITSASSLVLFLPALALVLWFSMPVVWAFALFGVALILVQIGLAWRLVAHLQAVYQAILALNHHQTTALIPMSNDDLLAPLLESVNELIRNHAALDSMRDTLVEQISSAATQEERNRLARDLHDSIKQQVFSMSISATAAYAHLDSNPSAARSALLDVKQSAQEALVEMRALLQQLSPAPLEKSGLVQALRDQCEALSYRIGAQVETHFGALPSDQQLPTGAQEALFRIAQEALSNIARHARAQKVSLSLDTDEHQNLVLSIRDDGQGFDVHANPSGMGLNNIHARAARLGANLSIHSQVGAGTQVNLSLPLMSIPSEEQNMFKQFEASLKPVVNYYLGFGMFSASFIIGISLIGIRFFRHPTNMVGDTITALILLVISAVVLVSVPASLWMLWRAHQRIQQVRQQSGADRRIAHYARRHLNLAYLTIAGASAWFLPLMLVQALPYSWTPVGFGGLLFLLAGYNYWRMGVHYKAELNLMSPSERDAELLKRQAEVRSGNLTTFILWVVIVISGMISGSRVQLPPSDSDHWMTLCFIVIASFFVVNQLIGTYVYRRWRAVDYVWEKRA